MIGVLVLSHGELANGMLDSIKLFFGDDIPQLKAECLHADDSINDFDIRIKDAVNELDDGHGVVILCDIFGGTPNNRCTLILNERIKVISGINFSLLMELLGSRLSIEDISELNINELIEVSKNGMVYLNDALTKAMKSQDDEE